LRRASLADTDIVQSIINEDPYRLLAEPRNILLLEGDNLAMFLWRWHGIYEGHVLFKCRGKEAEGLARQMLEIMSGAMILAVTPEGKRGRAVGLFLRRLGFTFKGTIETIEGLSQTYQLEAR
jgi:hypothetical protein